MLDNKNILCSSINVTIQPDIVKLLHLETDEEVFYSLKDYEKYLQDLEEYLDGLAGGYKLINDQRFFENDASLDDCYLNLYAYNGDNYSSIYEAIESNALYEIVVSIYGYTNLMDAYEASVNTQKALGYIESPLKYYFK